MIMMILIMPMIRIMIIIMIIIIITLIIIIIMILIMRIAMIMIVVIVVVVIISSPTPPHTHLDGGFRRPGHSNKEFLFPVKSSKVNQKEGGEQPDHQTDSDTSHAHTCVGQLTLAWTQLVTRTEQTIRAEFCCCFSPTVTGSRFAMRISAPIRPKRRGWNTSQQRPTRAATGA